MAGTVIGILAKDGVVLACEKKVSSKLLDDDGSKEKLYAINDSIIGAVAGMTADASILVNLARVQAQHHLKTYNEDIPCESLVKKVCDVKQGYTQHGGLRPFGVSFLYAGCDERYGFQLYTSNPSGNYSGWKATLIGANQLAAQTLLKKDYKDDMSLQDACQLAVKVLSKTMDSSNMKADKLELATLYKVNPSDEKAMHKIWDDETVTKLIRESGVLDDVKDE